jgi:hypothetical protein
LDLGILRFNLLGLEESFEGFLRIVINLMLDGPIP